MAQVEKLLIEQGATFRKTFGYASATKPVVVPIDITGWTARMQMRKKITDTTPLLSLTHVSTVDGQLLISGTAGTVQIYITDTATSALTGGGVFDVELISTTTDVVRLIQGTYSVSPNVTR
jgi:hypothetical protein